jgi:hypothetical protein
MASQALEYDTPCAAKRRRSWRVPAAVATLVFAFFALASAPVRRVESRVDGVTGSMRWTTVWFGWVTSGPRTDVSPLETYLCGNGVRWTPQWHTLHNTHRNLFGGATCYECGPAPPIYSLRSCLQEFVAASSHDEIRQFVRVMESGTEAEQAAAVDAADNKALP